MELNNEEKTLITDRLNYYAIRLMEVLEGQPSNESNNQRMEDLLLIKSIFEKLLVEEPERVVGMVNGVMSNITLEEIEENNIHNLKIINK